MYVSLLHPGPNEGIAVGLMKILCLLCYLALHMFQALTAVVSEEVSINYNHNYVSKNA